MHARLSRSVWWLIDIAALMYVAAVLYNLVSLTIAYARMPAWEMLGGALIEAGMQLFGALAVVALAYRFVQLSDDMSALRQRAAPGRRP